MTSYLSAAWTKFTDLLAWIGLFNRSGHICLLGLDNAGKSTLLLMLTQQKLNSLSPTIHAHREDVTVGNMNLEVWDVGGHSQMRRIWRHYMIQSDAVVFVVDASDSDRLMEAKEELDYLLTDGSVTPLPVLVLCNKIDKPTALSEEQPQMRYQLNLHQDAPSGRRPVALYMCSVVQRQGFAEGFNWLFKQF